MAHFRPGGSSPRVTTHRRTPGRGIGTKKPNTDKTHKRNTDQTYKTKHTLGQPIHHPREDRSYFPIEMFTRRFRHVVLHRQTRDAAVSPQGDFVKKSLRPPNLTSSFVASTWEGA